MRLSYRLAALPVMLAILFCVLPACNSKDSDSETDTLSLPPTDVAVTAFSIKPNADVLRALDSVYFSIDLEKAVIYNADSLPKGTDVTKLVPSITYSDYISSAIIEMTGGKVRTGTVNYLKAPGDSIDFSGRVVLTLTTSSGNSRQYLLKVNVHESDPDSLCWGETALSTLPARLASAPRSQRTVQTASAIYCLLQEADGSYTLASNPNPATHDWEKNQINPGFAPRVRTFAAAADNLFVLDDGGALHQSTDGLDWTATGQTWHNIIGGYGASLLGISSRGDSYSISSYPASADIPLSGDLADFPVDDFSNLHCYTSKWMQSPIAVLAGGVTAQGEIHGDVWGYDGISWAKLSTGQLPPLRGMTLIPYHAFLRNGGQWVYDDYPALLATGGLAPDGSLSKKVYLSYDNGVFFNLASTLMQLPEQILPFWQGDAVVASLPRDASLAVHGWTTLPAEKLPTWYRIASTVEGDRIYWQCPYVFLIGGCDAAGSLHDTIWRGVLNRLTFTPII